MSTQFAGYPSEIEVTEVKNVLKPPGLLSKNYNKHGLKKVERPYVSAKDATTLTEDKPMFQTDYFPVNTDKDSDYKQRREHSVYDAVNHVTSGYNQKLHRDDRSHAKSHGLRVHDEKIKRKVPLTSNAVYGAQNRRLLERHSKQHGRVEICNQDFTRESGVCLKEE